MVSKGAWGLHLLALKPSDFAHLEYIHTRCSRRILKIKAAYWSRISNAAVLERAKFPAITTFVGRMQFALLGHICVAPKTTPTGCAVSSLELISHPVDLILSAGGGEADHARHGSTPCSVYSTATAYPNLIYLEPLRSMV